MTTTPDQPTQATRRASRYGRRRSRTRARPGRRRARLSLARRLSPRARASSSRRGGAIRKPRRRAQRVLRRRAQHFDVQDLLDVAVASEDFAEAARLRDRLVAMRGDATAGVADANERFYHAFRTADAEAMRRVWGVGDHVQCLHPGSACISGADQVRESWDIVFSTMPPGAGMDVSAEQVRVHAADGWGFVTCVEKVNSDEGVGMLAATNVFEVQGDEWKIIHHHAHGLQGML